MPQPDNKDDIRAKKRATDDLNDIEALRKTPAWGRYWERRVLEEVQKLREKVLHDRKLTRDELFEERLRYLAALDTSKMMVADEAACKNIVGPGGGED